MSRTISFLAPFFLALVAIAILAGLVWANDKFIQDQPKQNDFLVPWLAARTFLQYGNNPYSDPASQRAQVIVYGKLASPGQDPLKLWLPLPFELFYFPFALIPDYNLALGVWLTCLEAALVALAALSLKLTAWKPMRVLLPLVLLSPLFLVHDVFSIGSGSAAGFVALAMVGFLLALRNGKDELAGGMLFFMATSPRLMGILIFFLFWWIIYQRRWRIIWGFLMLFGVLLVLSFLFLPGWVPPFLTGLVSHYTFSPGVSSIAILASWSPVVGLRIGWLATVVLALVLFLGWGNVMTRDFRAFLWMVCLTLSVTPLMGIPISPKEFAFLFIPLTLFLSILAQRRPAFRQWGVAEIVLVAFTACTWLLSLVLIQAGNWLGLENFLILFMPIFLVVGLTWLRWWYLHHNPTGLEGPA